MPAIQVGKVKVEGWRKFSLALVIILMGFAGLALGEVSGQEFVDLAQMVMLFFGAANVGVHFAQRTKDQGGGA